MRKLKVAEAHALVADCMVALDHSRDEARLIADHLIDCELRGLNFGGLPRALSVIERIRRTTAQRQPIRVLRETPVSASLDGGDQVGYLVAHRAATIAIEKARLSGIGIVGAVNSWYTGMFSTYMEMAAKAGFVAMAAGSSAHYVAPFGGSEGRFGTNPIAFGFPSDGDPVIWDVGTSAVMIGEVVLAGRLGELLPEGIAFDAAGRPTRDPAAALEGALAVWGGHKGSGLALVVQLLGMMCGASSDPPKTGGVGFLIVAIDPGLLTDPQDFRARVSAYADQVRATRPLDPERPVRMPFDRSAKERKARLAADEIAVTEAVYEALRAVAASAPGAG